LIVAFAPGYFASLKLVLNLFLNRNSLLSTFDLAADFLYSFHLLTWSSSSWSNSLTWSLLKGTTTLSKQFLVHLEHLLLHSVQITCRLWILQGLLTTRCISITSITIVVHVSWLSLVPPHSLLLKLNSTSIVSHSLWTLFPAIKNTECRLGKILQTSHSRTAPLLWFLVLHLTFINNLWNIK